MATPVPADSLAHLLIDRIASTGPLHYSEFVAEALYNPTFGFYATHGRAGRRGDFITSPEVGPLFGTCIARYLDDVWDILGRPVPFVVAEAGAGPGTLARTVLAAEPACREALDYHAVEISESQRADHPIGVRSSAELPAGPVHVILANELLDNLPFDLAVSQPDGWHEVMVGLADGQLVEVMNVLDAPAWLPAEVAVGTRIPLLHEAARWCRVALDLVGEGRVLAIDYVSSVAEIIADPDGSWVRTYRDNKAGAEPLINPGSQDITTQVPLEQISTIAPDALQVRTQAEFLRSLGIEELVDEGRRVWEERAHLGDLEAMKARSRIAESESLLESSGLGGFTVFEWQVPELG